MINRVRTIFAKALYYLRLWAKETDLSARQIAMIKDLRKEIKDLDNYDLCPAPTTEFQKIEQLRELNRLTEDFKDIRNYKKFNPQNEELNFLLVEIGNIDFQLIDAKYSRYSSLSESGLKEYLKSQTPQTKTIDKDNEQQNELVNLLRGRKELAEGLISITSRDGLRNWCYENSKFLNQEPKINARKLRDLIIELGNIKESFSYEAFNLWVRGK